MCCVMEAELCPQVRVLRRAYAVRSVVWSCARLFASRRSCVHQGPETLKEEFHRAAGTRHQTGSGPLPPTMSLTRSLSATSPRPSQSSIHPAQFSCACIQPASSLHHGSHMARLHGPSIPGPSVPRISSCGTTGLPADT